MLGWNQEANGVEASTLLAARNDEVVSHRASRVIVEAPIAYETTQVLLPSLVVAVIAMIVSPG